MRFFCPRCQVWRGAICTKPDHAAVTAPEAQVRAMHTWTTAALAKLPSKSVAEAHETYHEPAEKEVVRVKKKKKGGGKGC